MANNTKTNRMLKKILVVVVLLSLVGLAVFLVMQKLRTAPVYKTVAETEYVNQDEINKNIRSGNLSIIKPGVRALLPGAKWVPQSFNNCGPATTSMLLQYFGHNVDQNTTKAKLRTNADDKNVFTYEIQNYLKDDYNIDSKLF